ncbi:MAG: hypothetical protein WAN66_24715 [Limnoraphis robusta]|jgi:hypothetical protein|uniref:Uncharacterized protein n=3 Tax=Limnoraphis robusta TaxID=1118279 RepID=A0A0F5YP97_9CYAN|nr:hypothetical protein [Limnoraphis robusta]AAZ73683.1 hypothetical protein [Limnoraphis robusta CCAP 1446/4]MCG5057225.1 hypothetical protein [Limnoraphis sp. WC205]KKD40020.1 hypothetical protein WN50_00160 [Limnoraphis robusta CS-951]MEA5499324.1 hypothetical protein [Limnoraphis robusta BA-68 BA1]MEA5517998.1 hypothetical protein [Limnoraphis robusta CCNP1315]
MLEVGWFSTKLLLKGKLLQNPGYFVRQSAIGLTLGLLLFVGLDKVGVTLWLPIVLSSLLTGIAMPFLLKDVKMK